MKSENEKGETEKRLLLVPHSGRASESTTHWSQNDEFWHDSAPVVVEPDEVTDGEVVESDVEKLPVEVNAVEPVSPLVCVLETEPGGAVEVPLDLLVEGTDALGSMK